MSKEVVLRTCFRVGEALNTGSQAVRSGCQVIIEMYARVTSSWREPDPGQKQYFTFRDLYHDKPPHLEGCYELWKQARIWDIDSKAFLKAGDEGIMCRAMAKLKREEKQWKLQVRKWAEANRACHSGIRTRFGRHELEPLGVVR